MKVQLLAAVLVCSLGCSPTESDLQIDGLETQLREVRVKLIALESAVQKLQTASEELSSSQAGFDDTNWRDVVPEVKAATEEVTSALDEVNAALADAIKVARK